MQVLGHEIRGEAHEIIVANGIVLRDEIEILLERMAAVDALQHQLAHATDGLSVWARWASAVLERAGACCLSVLPCWAGAVSVRASAHGLSLLPCWASLLCRALVGPRR